MGGSSDRAGLLPSAMCLLKGRSRREYNEHAEKDGGVSKKTLMPH